ncbi:unnamed protein product [Cylindrotheca closterium]|uniref:Ubiquitin-like domain-containing protein n=1 Tax=Cylindrotheca closterium TaxID=2856 RepID=A0AAD2G5V8_9STRA|nr:unnamed protein product [Cylindrotheca closterium]
MSDSSSSDDEPLMESPCESDGDSDDDKDVFRYDRRRFIKAAPTAPTQDKLATPARAQRRRLKPSTDDQMSILEKRQEKKQKTLRARIDQTSTLNDDSDESIDDSNYPNVNADADTSIEILDVPDEISVLAATRESKKVIDLADSSDDDENVATIRSNIPTSDPLLQRSRLARLQLRQAQLYHAEDVDVDTTELEAVLPFTVSKASRTQELDKQAVENIGENMQIACIIKREINGKGQNIIKRQFLIKQNEPVQKLVSKILEADSLPASSRVKVVFHGVILEKHRTPASYNMVDEDQVDVEIAANIVPRLNSSRTKSDYGPSLNLKLRRRVGKNVQEIEMRIGSRQPLQQIIDLYREQQNLENQNVSLHFDGEKLDLSKTPLAYDMESGELVDVNCKGRGDGN